MFLVFSWWEVLSLRWLKRVSEEEISKLVSWSTSAKVGAISPSPNKKALSASDQK
jgi:hypothetical protein